MAKYTHTRKRDSCLKEYALCLGASNQLLYDVRIAYGPAQRLRSTWDESCTTEKGESQLAWNQQMRI